jgi:serine/threonine-protein kinase RsbT
VSEEIRVRVTSATDIVLACQEGRAMAAKLGFPSGDATLVATAISELARNIILYAGQGEVILRRAAVANEVGMIVVARDDGPGITDIEQAIQTGYSTSGGLGLGLPGVRRLMDEFGIVTRVGGGTTVTVKKWRRSRGA